MVRPSRGHPDDRRRAEHRARVDDPQVALPDVHAVDPHTPCARREHDIDPVVDDEHGRRRQAREPPTDRDGELEQQPDVSLDPHLHGPDPRPDRGVHDVNRVVPARRADARVEHEIDTTSQTAHHATTGAGAHTPTVRHAAARSTSAAADIA